MGRRKQLRPTRLAEDDDHGEPTDDHENRARSAPPPPPYAAASTSSSSSLDTSAAAHPPLPPTSRSAVEAPQKKTDFSIRAHLSTRPRAVAAEKPTKSRAIGDATSLTAASMSPSVSYTAAQRAYEALIGNLKRQESWICAMSAAVGPTATLNNPFLGACFPSAVASAAPTANGQSRRKRPQLAASSSGERLLRLHATAN